jgi:hypothetical protein
VWKLSESQGLRLSWDVFNVTNAVRFDVGTLNQYLLYGTTLGDFTETLTKRASCNLACATVFDAEDH